MEYQMSGQTVFPINFSGHSGDILIVDDTLANLQVLSSMLRERGYQVRGTLDGETALMIAFTKPPDLILMDIRMPHMDGIEVCRQLKLNAATNDIPVIFLSALNELDDKIRAFSSGGVDYITKPFQVEEVLARVKTHIRLHELTRRLEYKVYERTRELERAYDTTISGWARALELRDSETKGHSERVVSLADQLARNMGFDEKDLMHIRRGAMLHDIGKMAIPDSILFKPGPLTAEEMDTMRQHPLYAYELLKDVDFLMPAMDIPRFHHERWDGSGYNAGLKGKEIPLTARIFAVIDVWDALTSKRPYREAWSPAAANNYLNEQAGIAFDPEVVAQFIKMIQASPQT